MEKQTLLEVLNYIKQECANNDRCCTCPFYSDDDCCRIQKPPEEWKLKENEEEKKWTPFKD